MTAYGSVLTAGYRADGMRAWKQNSSGRTYFIYDGITPVLELNSAGSVVNLNIHAPDGLVARRQGTTDYHYLFDQQGSVSHRLDSSGTVLFSSTFDAYGVGSETAYPDDPFCFNARWGYYKDRETGLYLCTWRYYDPEKGRWLNRDPIGYLGGVNIYGYCEQRSNFSIDPSGLLYDSVSNFCRRYPAFCAELAGDLGGGVGPTFVPPLPTTGDAVPMPDEDCDDGSTIPPNPFPDGTFPTDPDSPPLPGFERGGPQEQWRNPEGDKLYPDLSHQEPIGPHWDYWPKDGGKFRIFPDGSIVPKTIIIPPIDFPSQR